MAKLKDHDILFFLEREDGVEYFVPYELEIWTERLKNEPVIAVVVGDKYEYLISVIHWLHKFLSSHVSRTHWGKILQGDPQLIKKLLETKMSDVVTIRHEESLEDFLSRARKNSISQEVGVKG